MAKLTPEEIEACWREHAKPSQTHDVEVTDHGTVLMFRSVTPAGADWVAENVEVPAYAWLGASFAADHRPARSLLEGMQSAGLRVSIR